MWQVGTDKTKELIVVFDNFVLEFLEWAVKHKGRQKRALQRYLNQDKSKLGKLAKEMKKVRELLMKCARSSQIEEIKNAYQTITRDYDAFLSAGAHMPKMSKEAYKLAKQVFQYFYESLFDSQKFWKYYAETEQLKKSDFRRKLGSYRSVCPYCDAAKISYEKKSNTDHFLAFTHFPYLSVYWENLVVSCSACNTYVKNAKVIGTIEGIANHIPIFHPYFNQAADYIFFTFEQSKVQLLLSNDANFQDYAQNYSKMFELKEQYELESMWDETGTIRRTILSFIEERYLESSNLNGESNEDKLKRIIKQVVERQMHIISQSRGKEMLTKLRTDLCNYYLTDGFNELEKKMSVHLELITPLKNLSPL